MSEQPTVQLVEKGPGIQLVDDLHHMDEGITDMADFSEGERIIRINPNETDLEQIREQLGDDIAEQLRGHFNGS